MPTQTGTGHNLPESLPPDAPGGGAVKATVPALRSPPEPDPPPPVATRAGSRRWWPVAAALALAAALGGAVYFHPWAPSPTLVAVETVVPGALTRVLAVNGTIEARNSVSVRAQVSGKLVALHADAADKVAAGDVLAEIDSARQQAVLRTAQAALDAGTLAQAQASATRDRAMALGPNATRNALEDAERSLQSATQEVGRLAALVDQAKIELAQYTVTAPISGTVLTRGVDPGQLVDSSSDLFTLADLGQLVVETNVDETYATQIAPGQPAVLQFVGETQTRTGSVSFVAPQVDVATGGLAVRISFDTPQTAPVGLTVTANVIVDQKEAAISAPRTAIVTDAAGPAVFVLREGLARRQPVSLVDWPAARLEVTAGLAAGDVLIVQASGLSDGQAVTAGGQ